MVIPKNESVPATANPFDDDESFHIEGDARDAARRFSKWIRPSGMVAAVSLAVAIIASVVSNNAAGDRNIEDLAFSVNRFASLVMLLGCFGLLIGFRGEQVVGWFTKRSIGAPMSNNPSPTVWSLFLRSIFVFLALAIAVTISGVIRFEAAVIAVVAFYSLYLPLLVTSAVFYSGTARAFSIGMATNFLFLLLGYFGIGGVVFWQSFFWGPSRFNIPGSIVFWQRASLVIAVCGTQALMILSGLICAWYAKVVTQNDAIQVGSPELTTLPQPPASINGTEVSA